jgi:hypothetical protein
MREDDGDWESRVSDDNPYGLTAKGLARFKAMTPENKMKYIDSKLAERERRERDRQQNGRRRR